MSENFTKKIELFANIAIIVVAVVLTGVLIKKFVFNDSSAAAISPKENISIGTKVNLPEVDWAANGQTLMLVLSTDCHFCHESLPFYQKLTEQNAGSEKIKIVAVFPQETAVAENYLKTNGVTVNRVYQAQPPNIGVGGTPTLLLVDRNGAVTQTWLGKLGADQQQKVFESLAGSIQAQGSKPGQGT